MSFVSSSNVGSCVLSTSERPGSAQADLQTACARVLKLPGSSQAGMSGGALLSATGFSESLLRQVIAKLAGDELVKGHDEGYFLTELGFKAHLIVAT